MHYQPLKKFFCKTTRKFSIKLGIKHSKGKGNFSSLLQMKGITHSFLFESRAIYLSVRCNFDKFLIILYNIVKTFKKRQDRFTDAHFFNMYQLLLRWPMCSMDFLYTLKRQTYILNLTFVLNRPEVINIWMLKPN